MRSLFPPDTLPPHDPAPFPQMSLSDESNHLCAGPPRLLDSGMRERQEEDDDEDSALSTRATASSSSYLPISPHDSLHPWSPHPLPDAADAEDRMSGSSRTSSITASVIRSSSDAAESADAAASSHDNTEEEGQGESTCDEQFMWSRRFRKRGSELGAAGDDMVMSAKFRRPYLQDAARHSQPMSSTQLFKDIEQEQEYFQQILGSSSHGWTDEKHSSYLDSMEADFLRSVMFKDLTQQAATTDSSELTDSATSQQVNCKEFKMYQNGRWRPMRSPTLSYVGPLMHVAVAVKNPWMKRFRPCSAVKVAPVAMECDARARGAGALAAASAMGRDAHDTNC